MQHKWDILNRSFFRISYLVIIWLPGFFFLFIFYSHQDLFPLSRISRVGIELAIRDFVLSILGCCCCWICPLIVVLLLIAILQRIFSFSLFWLFSRFVFVSLCSCFPNWFSDAFFSFEIHLFCECLSLSRFLSVCLISSNCVFWMTLDWISPDLMVGR